MPVERAIAVFCDDESAVGEVHSAAQALAWDGGSSGGRGGVVKSIASDKRIFCWQAYVKGPARPGMG